MKRERMLTVELKLIFHLLISVCIYDEYTLKLSSFLMTSFALSITLFLVVNFKMAVSRFSVDIHGKTPLQSQ